MCVVSAVGDNWGKTVPNQHPWVYPTVTPGVNPAPYVVPANTPTREEFDKLKREVQELKKLLVAAKEFDEKTGQPDCHVDEKVELIKKLAEYVGVDVADIFGDNES